MKWLTFYEIAFSCQLTAPASLLKYWQNASRTAMASFECLLLPCFAMGLKSLDVSGFSGMYPEALVGLRSKKLCKQQAAITTAWNRPFLSGDKCCRPCQTYRHLSSDICRPTRVGRHFAVRRPTFVGQHLSVDKSRLTNVGRVTSKCWPTRVGQQMSDDKCRPSVTG